MPELDWLQDILPNRERFPDEMQWPIDAAGNTVSLGTLRRAVVPSQQYQTLERVSNDRYQALMREKAELDRRLVERLSVDPAAPGRQPPQTPAHTPSTDDLYSTDPILAPIWGQTKTALTEIDTLKQTLAQMNGLLQQFQTWPGQVATVLKAQQLQAQEPGMNMQKVFETATDLQKRAATPGGILDDAARLVTYDDKLAAARAEGERQGREAAQQEWAAAQANTPFMPSGSGAISMPTNAPKFETEQSLLAGVLQDPDLQRVWMGQLDSLPAVA